MNQIPAGQHKFGRGNLPHRNPEDDPQELLRAGVYLLRREEPREAMRLLERAHRLDARNPLTASYLGLAMAICRSGTKQEAIKLCEKAVEGTTFHAELYHNLGRVYLITGDRRRARLAFLEGLKLDQDDPDLTRELEKLGKRRLPPLSVVHRDHPCNKYLGIALRRLGLR